MLIALPATLFTIFVIVTLFRLDQSDDGRPSIATWIPFIWLFIESSRPVSAWIHLNVPGNITNEYIDGSPLDRNILTVLLAIGLVFLSRRLKRVGAILASNPAIILYFLFCLVSLIWADYPFVVFKRWVRSVGDVVMLLILITEQDRLSAFKRIFTRVGYLVIPLSILLIRFYPSLGRFYSRGGSPEWTGVGTDKNALGMICMLYGAVFLWRWLDLYSVRKKSPKQKRTLTALGLAMTMVVYLLIIANSQTALSCFAMASVIIVATAWSAKWRRPGALTMMVVGMVAFSYCVLIAGIGSWLLTLLGRNPTLTGRTAVWDTLLANAVNPWIGAGYENFWIGERVELFNRILGGLNQAHNGYIEIYLNMGFAGLAFLAGVLIAGYRNILWELRHDLMAARLKAAFFVICVIYNFTEASFKMMSPVWFTFLWAVMMVPSARKVKAGVPVKTWGMEKDPVSEASWETATSAPASRFVR
jgi:exopolysaccharide production protein ExoQ